MRPRWVVREPPLAVEAVAARGDAAAALIRALLRRDDAALAQLRGVRAGDRLFIEGATLPWIDADAWPGELHWLGAVGPLRMPTRLGFAAEGAPLDDGLLASAVLAVVGRGPVAIWPADAAAGAARTDEVAALAGGDLLSLADAGALDRGALERLLCALNAARGLDAARGADSAPDADAAGNAEPPR